MIRLKLDNVQLLQALREKGSRVAAVLLTKSTALMIMLQSKIVSEKLSGQILHRRSGILSASVQPILPTVEGTKIRFGVEAAAGPAFYGQIHEEGGSRAYEITNVRARALAFVTNGKTIFARSVLHPPAQMRAFMRPSAEEFFETVREELSAVVRGILNK